MRSLAVAAVVAAGALVEVGGATAHRAPEFAKTLTEKQLRVYETKVYGRRHAADHARARLEQRRIAVRAKRGLAPRRVPKGVLRALAIGTPDQVGVWEKPSAIPVFAINAVLLVTGKVLFHSYVPQQGGLDDPEVAKQSRAVVWDPATKTVVKVEPRDQSGEPVNVWCSGQTVLPDGRVVIVGGNIPNRTSDFDSPDFKGESRIFTFNPYTYKWIDQGRMAHGRWYPGVVALPDGRVLITSGRDEVGNGDTNKDVEVFTPSKDMDGKGTIRKVGEKDLGLYPHGWVMPDGRVYIAGPNTQTGFFDPATDFTWERLESGDLNDYRGYGSGVLIPGSPVTAPRFMLIGGDGLSSTEEIDFSQPDPEWHYGAPLPQNRRNANTVLLPDGTFITVGGTVGTDNYDDPVKEAVLYDPKTQAWTAMASQLEPRGYHSTALLLPDGRVLSAGDDGDSEQDAIDKVEIFSPPYLFKGPRPTITSAPVVVNYASPFTITTPDQNVTRAVLMAPGATTHANDMTQRHIELPLTRRADGTGVDVVSPANLNVAVAGTYMLFLLNDQGVPSVAKALRLDPTFAPPPPPPPSPPPVEPPPPPPPTLLNVTPPPAPPADATVWSQGFESRRLPKGTRAGQVRLVRSSHTGRYAVELRGGKTAEARLVQSIAKLKPGKYRLRMWMRGRLAQFPEPTSAHSFGGTWRLVEKNMRVKRGRPLQVELRVRPGGWAVVDDLRLTRIGK